MLIAVHDIKRDSFIIKYNGDIGFDVGQAGDYVVRVEVPSMDLPFEVAKRYLEANGEKVPPQPVGPDTKITVKSVKLVVNAQSRGNETRVISDYRGIRNVDGTKKRANWRFQEALDAVHAEFLVGVFATQDIKTGEELLLDYGAAYWKLKESNTDE